MIYTNNIFSNSTVKPSNIQSVSDTDEINSLDTYMLESLLYLNESYYNISREHAQIMHMGLLDDNADILEEGFNDFINKVKEFFSKLANSIAEFFKKASAYISSFFGDFDKFIQKNKALIDKADPDFEIKGYEYSFENNTPDLSHLKNLIYDFNTGVRELDKLTKEDLLKMRTEYSTTDHLNELRGEVLGVRRSITQDEYLAQIKEHFRDNKSQPDTIHVDKSMLQKVVNEYSSLKKKFMDAQKEKNDTIKLINDIKNFFERSARVQYNDKNKVIATNEIEAGNNKLIKGDSVKFAHTTGTLEIVNMYFKFRFDQAKNLSIMTTNVFNEKIKAMRECLHLYRAIVRRSIISKTDKEGAANK